MSFRIENLHFAYFEDGRDILSGVNCDFDRKKITLLTGNSGCGKSTLLYVMAGLYPHNSGFLREGTVSVDGKSPESLPPHERCRLVGMMFQNPDLQFCMDTVRNELIFCLENIGEKPENFESIIDSALEFCGIRHLKDRILNTLSGGEKQRVALASIVMLDPKWLLLDEPFANVDDASAGEILSRLRKLHDERGTGIVAVDHRLENWSSIADGLLFMKKGRILEADEAAQAGAELAEERYGKPVPGPSGNLAQDKGAGSPLLSIRNLSVKLGGNDILKNICADFFPDTIYAIVGQSGCGKSTFFGAVSGLNDYDGTILYMGKDIKKIRKKIFGEIGFVTQNPQDQFIGGNVAHEIGTALRKTDDAEKKCEEILRDIKLWSYRDISPYMLSQGQQRRLGVAALMAYPCRLLVCDEPTYAQDFHNTVTIMENLTGQVRSHHAAMLFSTHDRAMAAAYADHVLEMKGGELYEVTQSVV